MTFKYISPEQTFISDWLLNIATWLSQRNCNPNTSRREPATVNGFSFGVSIVCEKCHHLSISVIQKCRHHLSSCGLLYLTHPIQHQVLHILSSFQSVSSFLAIILGQITNISYLDYFKCHPTCLPLGSLQFVYHTTAAVMFTKHKTPLMLPVSDPSVPSHCS